MVSIVSEKAHAVVSVRISGHPASEELREMAAELKEQISRHGLTRVLFQLEHFFGWKAEAHMAKTLFKHLTLDFMQGRGIERLAVVGEVSWERWVTGVLRPVVRAEVRYFAPSRLEDAWAWLHEAAHGQAPH